MTGSHPASASTSRPSALRLSSLEVRRMPGIPDGFALTDLSDGVTVVYGPNGSGKSSTARAIEAALWPGESPERRICVRAEYSIDASVYSVEVDTGHVAVQRDGAEARVPELPAPELRHRYSLSLHELMKSDDADFASAIALQSAGGYDLAAAASELGFADRPSQSRTESAAVAKAMDDLRAAQRAQADLEERARGLDDLVRRRDAARAARERQSLLVLAVKHCTAAAEAERARQAVADFPAALEKIRGNEHERLPALREKIRECDGALGDARADEEASARAAAELLGNGAPEPSALASLRALSEALRECQRKEAECERSLDAATARQAESRRALGGSSHVTDEQLARIEAGTFGELSNFAREAERLRARADAVDAALRRLGDSEPPAELDSLIVGIKLLGSWLAEGDAGTRGGGGGALFLWGAAALAAVAWGLHAVRWHWAFGIFALLAILVAVLGARNPASDDSRAALRRQYERLPLQRPGSWGSGDVRKLFDILQARLAEARVAEQRARLREQAARERAELEEPLRSLAARSAELAARLGVAPDTDERQLSWLVDRITQWHGAALDVASSRGALDTARRQYASSLALAAGRLGEFGYETLESPADVAGATEDLERRVREHERATGRMNDARRRIAELQRARGEHEQECEEILRCVGAQDDHTIEQLCARFDEYGKACEARRFAVQTLDALRSELRGTPGYEPDLEERTLATLEMERDQASSAAGELDALTADLARLEQAVDTAKHASDVESALAAVAAARAALEAARQEDLRAMIGNVVLRHVQQLTRDRHRPEVFHRARELFAVITRGRYRLDFADGDEPTFRAFDVNEREGRALEELSSATRVQLILAVRVAFVESQERRIRLPLLLDETLGTSDDERARAIIDAVIALAGEGRQIFYFTAQHDEAGKWVAALEESGTPHSIVDLAAVRGHGSTPSSVPLPIAGVAVLDVVEPDGCSHDDYGARLGVPALRPGIDSPDSTPLWYVVDEPDALYNLMRSGIRTWGELRNLVENGGRRMLDGYPGVWERASAFARALEALYRQAEVGHGRPVDRAALVQSDAVSELQLEKVVALATRCNGDARSLITELETGGVPGFRRKKTAMLREYLEHAGYLDERQARTPEQLRFAMIAAVNADVAAGVLAPSDVDTLLRRLELRRKPVAPGALPSAGAQPESLASRISTG